MVIPIKYVTPNGPNYEELEDLMFSYWNIKLSRNRTYVPFDEINKKVNNFHLFNFFQHITKLKARFFLYLGSHTTPPCKGKLLFL